MVKIARPGKRRRRYDSSGRRAAAAATRAAILDSARSLFLARGYPGTTMPAIAAGASVALDTVYAAVGSKPRLFRLLVEAAISGGSDAVPVEERDYVQAIRAAPDAASKLRIYAAALRSIQPRLAPLFQVLQAAAPLDEDLKALWQDISQRRAANMQLLAQDLAATGQLRRDLTVPMVADIIWSMNAPEFYLLLAEQRAWPPERFEHWLADAWIRLLLEP
jgi:AcrR family transcriptional regulator